ncbi:MAG: DUF418 domain-containing protein [Proteobacteria bacterium]|nr:DUF418 domain-containing protein [Pseudomonadota bacterium]
MAETATAINVPVEDCNPATPITGKARIQSIDTLRGVALLGILLMNIIAFALPSASYFDPSADSATSGINLATFMGIDILFEGSMRAIFSMLFGAGLLIFASKPNTDQDIVRGLYYRRTFLLIGFGLVNAYIFVWPGDILYSYGMAGLILYFFKDYSAKQLGLYSLLLLLVLMFIHAGLHYDTRRMRDAVVEIEALPAGTILTEAQQTSMDEWQVYMEGQFATQELIAQDIETRQGGYLENFRHVASINIFTQTVMLVIFFLWDALAMMLLGMAFMKWKIFDASRSTRFYLGMILVGFGVGIPVNAWETITFVNSGFEQYWTAIARPTYDLGRMTLAIGYIGLVMLICKSGVLAWLRSALAAVGQMALTNYLSQSVICNFIFMGFGLGLAGELERVEIYYVVFGVWIFQLFFSVYWLKRYRFGPVEWLWRSLTYKKKQDLRLQSA